MHHLKCRGRRTPISLACFALLAIAPRAGAAIPAPERLLPDDTLVVLTAPDFTKLQESWYRQPQSQLWADPSMKPFRASFVKKWDEEFIQPLERELNIKCADYTRLLKGQVTFALTQNGWQGGTSPVPGVLLLLDTKEQSNQLKKNLASLRKQWTESGKALRTTKVRDIEFTVVPISSNDLPKTLQKFFPQSSPVKELGDDKARQPAPGAGELWIGQVESLLVLSSSMQSVEKVVARATGGALPPLADLASYQADQARFFRNARLYGWINLNSFIDILTRNLGAKKENAAAPNPFDLNPSKILGAVGLGGLKSLAVSYEPSGDGSLLQLALGVPESARQGLFKILAGEPRETRPPAFVPADAVKFQRWRIDGQKTWETVQKIVNDISPQWMSGINFLIDTANTAAKEKDPGFDLRKNLLGNLGDDVISYSKAPKDNPGAGPPSAPSLFLVGSPNAEAFAAAFKSILIYTSPQPGASPDQREFLGRRIYSVPLRAVVGSLGGSGPGVPQNLTYAASGGYVAFSSDPALVEEYLRTSDGQHDALREKPGLSDAAQKVIGPDSSLFGYENQVEATKAFVELLRKNAAVASAASMPSSLVPSGLNVNATVQGFRGLMDFSLLPPFESIAKYFSFSVYGGSADVDGLTLKMFYPFPPGLKASAAN